MSLEKELALLHFVKNDNCVDQSRHQFILLAQEDKIMKLVSRIEALESFIIEQDEVNLDCDNSSYMGTRVLCMKCQ